jgi:hypothetical protein
MRREEREEKKKILSISLGSLADDSDETTTLLLG